MEVFGSKCTFCAFGNFDLVKEVCASVVSDLLPNEHGEDNTGDHTANSAADRSEYGELSSFTCIFGNDVKHCAVRNVCHCVSCVPNDVTEDEEDRLDNSACIGEGKEYCRAANEKTDRTDKYVSLIFTELVLSLVAVDERTDKGVIDSIPRLNEKEEE